LDRRFEIDSHVHAFVIVMVKKCPDVFWYENAPAESSDFFLNGSVKSLQMSVLVW
jgi:hypothetical protein